MIESSEKLRKITGLYIASSDDILSIIETGQSSAVTFSGDNDWEEIKFTSCIFSEPSTNTVDGDIYNQKLEVVMAGDDVDFAEILIYYQRLKPVVKIEYDNGDSKLMGNKQNYCKLALGGSSENFETKSTLIFTREDYRPIPFIIT